MVAAAERRHLGDRSGAATSAAVSASPRVRSTSPCAYAASTQRLTTLPRDRRHEAEDLERRRLVRLRLREADGLLSIETSSRLSQGRHAARSAPWFRSARAKSTSATTAAKLTAERRSASTARSSQIKADATQYNLSKRTAMYTTVSRAGQQGRHAAITLAAPRAGASDRRRQVEGLRIRPASLLLIGRSPRASFRSELKGRLRAAFFMAALDCERIGAFPFDAWRAFCSHPARCADAFRLRRAAVASAALDPPSCSHARLRPSPPRPGRPRDADGRVHRLHAVPVRRRSGHQHPRPGRDAAAAPATARRPRPRPARFRSSSRASSAMRVRGEFGLSLRQGRKVSSLIAERLPATLELSLLGGADRARRSACRWASMRRCRRGTLPVAGDDDDLADRRVAADLPDRHPADPGLRGHAEVAAELRPRRGRRARPLDHRA